MKQFLIWLLILFSMVPLQSFSPQVPGGALQRELEELRQHGVTYRFLNNDMIEITDPASGLKRVKTLQEPSEAAIRSWAAARNVPILEINPATLDTSRWSGWFRYWTTLPLSNGFGSPLVVGDLDENSKPEVYGIYKSYTSDFETHIYEVDSNGNSLLLHNYVPRLGPSRQFADVNSDSLAEIIFAFGNSEYDFEQSDQSTLPTIFKFRVQRDSTFGSLFTGISIGDLDQNGLTDMAYSGSGRDSLYKVFVAEYDSLQGTFVSVWSSNFGLPRGGYFGGFTGGDFDGDGKQEFQCSEITGKVYVVESTGIHTYANTWSDSTPYVNLFYQTAGDIDRDGKREFYVGATMYNGNWTTMYETDSNDHYSPRFIFHLLSGGSLDEPTYLTPDVDLDGKPELLILSGADLYIFKSNADDSFFLWYYRRFDAKESIQFYDFNHDGKEDFILSRARVDSLGRGAHFADIYLAQRFTDVHENGYNLPQDMLLAQNFPNPFNPVTRIQYSLEIMEYARLDIFDLTGKFVMNLLDDKVAAGTHTKDWTGMDEAGKIVSSGVYFCRLTAGGKSQTIKMLLVR